MIRLNNKGRAEALTLLLAAEYQSSWYYLCLPYPDNVKWNNISWTLKDALTDHAIIVGKCLDLTDFAVNSLHSCSDCHGDEIYLLSCNIAKTIKGYEITTHSASHLADHIQHVLE